MASPNSIGLYLGTETVDLVALSGSFQRPRLVSFGRVQLPQLSVWRAQVRAEEVGAPPGEGEPSAPAGGVDQDVVQAVKTLLQKTGQESGRLYAAIAPEAFVIRYFQMPTIPVKERRTAVSFEAKKYLPFKLEELVTDSQIVVQKTDPTLMRIMFFGIKKSSVKTVLALLNAVNLKPLCLEAAPSSLMRSLRQAGQLSAGEAAAILSVERDTATITIARDDLLYLSRNVTILPTAGPGEGTSTELLEALINETRVSIDYYRRRFLGEPGVSKVILFSKEMDEKRVHELTTALDLPVEMGEPFQRIEGKQDVPSGLAVATGLALRGLEKKARGPNLLPPELRGGLQDLTKLLAAEAAVALLVLGVWYGLSFSDLHGLKQKIRDLELRQVLPAGVSGDAPIESLQNINAKQDRELAFLRQITDTTVRHTEILAELAHLIPEEAWLQSALLEDTLQSVKEGPPKESRRSLTLTGASYLNNRDKELEGINNFLASLKGNETFNKVFAEFSLDGVNRGIFQEEEVTQFRLTCASESGNKEGQQ